MCILFKATCNQNEADWDYKVNKFKNVKLNTGMIIKQWHDP